MFRITVVHGRLFGLCALALVSWNLCDLDEICSVRRIRAFANQPSDSVLLLLGTCAS